MTTTTQIKAALMAAAAVGDAIRELGSVPSGEMYAHLSGALSIETYQRIICTLKSAGLVEERGHVLRWIGPAK